MRLVTFASSGKQELIGLHVGPLQKGTLIDIAAGFNWLRSQGKSASAFGSLSSRPDMLELIREQDSAIPLANELLRSHAEGKLPASLLIQESTVALLSPIPRPVSMRDGYAFRQHVEAARRNRGLPMIPEFDHFPIFYFTNHLAVTGPGDIGVQKLTQDKLDFELEAAIVIGRKVRNVSASNADSAIFGYMIMNDWSARALQMEEMKLNLGPAKGKDFATSLGPYLVTRDELKSYAIPGEKGERHDLRMRCWVNGKVVSDGNLKDMTWTFGQIVERAAYGVTLQPGEVIGSGTVGTGCFLELNGSKITDNQWLKPGDHVVLEIDQLGRLENSIRAEDESE